MPSPHRERRRIAGSERIGVYTLLRLERGRLDAGHPGQFFMLDVPGHIVSRPFSICLAPKGELAFLIDPVGPATRVLCELERGQEIGLFGPLGNGFRTDVTHPLLVGGGIGIAPLPYLSQVMGNPPAVLGFRSRHQSEAAGLVPNAEVCIEPKLVTELVPQGRVDVLACGPEPMLHAVHALNPEAQLAWEAPMACGYGACYGCVVEFEGRSRRLCVEGPILNGRPPVPPIVGTEERGATK
ncbi:MAG: dihydroorotate dehydrogenase electron transfer subunit [Gaiellaceae bacterium]